MKEIITRRYMRQAREEQGIPQLVIVDGGKGQLSSAVEAHRHIIELCKKENIDEKILSKIQSIRLIGIAKRLEEIYFPNDPTPLYLNKNSESLKLIQQIRDEAHRFGITFHRKLRSKVQIKSELDEIPGIGKVTKNLLLEHFKSLKKIREADSNELEKIVGKSKANNIINYFKSK